MMTLLEEVTPREAACARLQAESRLIRRYADEYRDLFARRGHVFAVCVLVRKHRREYETILRARARTSQGASSPRKGFRPYSDPSPACHGDGGG